MIRNVAVAYFFALVLVIGGLFYSMWGLEGLRENALTVVPAFGLLGLLCLLVHPLLMLALVFAYFPFSWGGPSVELGVITFNPYSIGLIFFALIAMLRLFFMRTSLKLSTTDMLLAGVCAVYLWGTVRSSDPTGSGFLAFNFVFLPVLSFFIIRLLVDSEERYRLVMRYAVFGLCLFAVAAILSWVQTGLRATPLDTPPIGTATLMVFAICMILGSGVVPRWMRIPLSLLCLLAMFLTFSRVFIVLTLVAPFCYLLIRKGKSATLFITFFLASMAVTFLLVAYANLVEPDQLFFKEEEHRTEQRLTNVENWKKSIYGRVSQFTLGLRSFLENPYLGVGLYRGEELITQHNFHVEWLEYSGLIGYALYLFFFITHALRMSDLARRDGPVRWQMLAILLVLNNCLFNGIMHGYMPHVIFICMGLNEARDAFLRREAEAREGETAAPEPRRPKREPLRNGSARTEEPVMDRPSGDELYERYFRS